LFGARFVLGSGIFSINLSTGNFQILIPPNHNHWIAVWIPAE